MIMKNKINTTAICNLCSAELPVDDCWDSRASQHEIWHSPRGVTSRLYVNTVRGKIKWKFIKNTCYVLTNGRTGGLNTPVTKSARRELDNQ